jgi:hypothetical protein
VTSANVILLPIIQLNSYLSLEGFSPPSSPGREALDERPSQLCMVVFAAFADDQEI